MTQYQNPNLFKEMKALKKVIIYHMKLPTKVMASLDEGGRSGSEGSRVELAKNKLILC